MYQTQQSQRQTTPKFLSKENLKDLFETLVENEFSDFTQIMKSQDTDSINNTFQLFCKKAVDFYQNHIQLLEIEDYILFELNKKFIIHMLRTDKKPVKNVTIQQQQPIQQRDVKIEEIQKQRQQDFYQQLESKKNEFMNSNTKIIPEPPKFGDTVIDKPIKNISALLNSMMEDRNKDLEEIQKLYPKKKQEKHQQQHQHSQFEYDYFETKQPQIKYITIDANDTENQIIENELIILDETTNNNKKVSWEDESVPEIIVEEPTQITIIQNNDNGFLEKLKIVSSEPEFNHHSESNEQLFSLFNNRFECLEDKINKIFELLSTQQK
jgi:hypothetical protein